MLTYIFSLDALFCSGKSNAFGVSYVTTEGDKSVDPPPTIEELVEHGNGTWEVRSLLAEEAFARPFGLSCGFPLYREC